MNSDKSEVFERNRPGVGIVGAGKGDAGVSDSGNER